LKRRCSRRSPLESDESNRKKLIVFSHELQTCDWPRNVACTAGQGGSAANRTPTTRKPLAQPVEQAISRDQPFRSSSNE
jgi:hypothetical protein